MGINRYVLTLTTLGPVFIGDGKDILKKEYIFDPQKKKVHIIDMFAFYQFLRQKHLEAQYEEFILRNHTDDLKQWLEKMRVAENDWKPFIRYSMGAGDALEEMRSRKEIKSFIKDPEGYPYLPGSSVKGALRTMILSYLIQKQEEKAAGKDNIKRNITSALYGGYNLRPRNLLQKEAGQVEKLYLNTLDRPDRRADDIVNDAMSQIIVGDSAPITTPGALILCQKIDRHRDGEEKKLPILRECLKPGLSIKIDLSIYDNAPAQAGQILTASRKFEEQYFDNFSKKFGLDLHGEERVFRLGGGAGYQTKTITQAVCGEDALKNTATIMQANFSDHGHDKDVGMTVSPHTAKMTQYQGKDYEMGLVSMRIGQVKA